MVIRIALGDCQTIFRQGMKHMLEANHDFKVVGDTSDGAELTKVVGEASPDIVIADVMMKSLDGVEATRIIRTRNQNTRVIALSTHTDMRFVIGMLTAGASGYLSKDCCFEELAEAIRTVASGRTYLSSPISDIVVNNHFHNQDNGSDSLSVRLSPREREVLQLLAEGKTVKEIACHLSLSVKTIETYRHQIMNKLNVHSIAELTKYAIREGLIPLGQ